mmetsp:Transcript_16827/g.44464  ORF Transcript_16827/g.44464 Transcript_16827/m.44464 type:complete len:439 (+) Transcript_16827:67-1383(+)
MSMAEIAPLASERGEQGRAPVPKSDHEMSEGASTDTGSASISDASSPRSSKGEGNAATARAQPACATPSKPRWSDISEVDVAFYEDDLEDDELDCMSPGGPADSPSKSSKRSARRRRRREEASKYAAAAAVSAVSAAADEMSQQRGVVLLGDIGFPVGPATSPAASGNAASASPTARGALMLPTGAMPMRARPSQVCPGTPTAAPGVLGIMSTSPRADIMAASCDASARTPVRHPTHSPSSAMHTPGGGGVHFAPMLGGMLDPRSPTDASARTPSHNFGTCAPPCTPSTPATRRAAGDASTRTPVAAASSPLRTLWPQAFEQQHWPQHGGPGAAQQSSQYHCAQGNLAAMSSPTRRAAPVPCFSPQAASPGGAASFCGWGPQTPSMSPGIMSPAMSPAGSASIAGDALRDLARGGAPLPAGEDLDRMLRAAAPEAYED